MEMDFVEMEWRGRGTAFIRLEIGTSGEFL